MSLSRNTVIRPTDFNVPLLQIPVDAIYGQMQQYQNEYDTVGQLTSLLPQHIEKDAEWANKYKAYTSEISNAVTDAFAKGDTTSAIRTLRNAQQALASEWKPGGLAYALQDRYSAYNQGIEELKKAHEKDPTHYNRAYGQEMFNKSIGDLDYDYTTSKYNRIGSPTIFNYVDIPKRLQEEVKAMIPDVTEQDFINGMWIERLREKGYSEDRIKGIWSGILNSPEIQQQLAVENYNKTAGFGEEGKAKYLEDYNSKLITSFQNQKKEFKKLSITDKQKYLKKLGYYNGAIDGKKSDLYTEAEAQYADDSMKEYQNNANKTFDEVYLQNEIVNKYQNQFLGYLGQEKSHTLRPNQVALQQQRLAHAKKLQDREFAFQQSLMEKENESGLYTPTQAVNITEHFNKARQDAKQLADATQKDLTNVMRNAGIEDQSLLNQAVSAFEKSNNFEEFKTKFPGVDPNTLWNTYSDLKANAATYKTALVNAAKSKETLDRINQQEAEIYKQTAPSIFNESYKQLKQGNETEVEFIKSATIAAGMTNAELTKSKDPLLKRFLGGKSKIKGQGTYSSSSGKMPENINLAKQLVDRAKTETNTQIKSGKFTPNTGVRYSLSGLNSKYGGGRLSAAVKQDLKTGSLYGYEDFSTGNTDEFTDIHGKKVSIDNLDPATANVEYDSGWGQPSYFITAKDTKDGKYKTIRVKPPATHNSLIETTLDQEIAIGVNNGDLKSAARAARFREEQYGNVLDIAGGTIKPTNKNITGTKMQAKLNDMVVELDRPYTTSYKTPYESGYDLEIVTFQDRDGRQKWATALTDENNNRTIIGKAEKRDGTIKPKINHTNLSDMLYQSYSDALDNISLFKAINEIPVNEVYESIPKDLRGLGLGKRIPAYRGTTVTDDDANNDDDTNDNK